MPRSDASWSGKLRRITDLERPDHHHLRADDECYFVGEYTPRAGYAHSATNGLISNLKKKPHLRNTLQWPHKRRAIRDVGAALKGGLKPEAREQITFVPIPPSKLPSNPEYDDRMLQVAGQIGPDVRELISLVEERDAAHENTETRNPHLLQSKLRLQDEHLTPTPIIIALVDDLLTTGCSFRACKVLIRESLPDVRVIGLFVARRVPDNASFDFDDFDGE